MTTPSYMILFVKNPRASAEIYAGLFGIEPVHLAADFVLFILPHGYKFALWASSDPEAAVSGETTEVAILLDDYDAVDRAFGEWSKKKVDVLMEPKTLAFGRSFVVTDTDGHRTRVMAMADDPK